MSMVEGAADASRGTAGIAARLSQMFTTLPEDTIHGVLSELFRANPNCSRNELADLAVTALLDMGLGSGEPQSMACFEPANAGGATSRSASPRDSSSQIPTPGRSRSPANHEAQEDVGCGHEERFEATAINDAEHFWGELDELLANLLGLPDGELGICISTMVGILGRISAEPNNVKLRRLRLGNQRFAAEVGRHEPAVLLLRYAGFEDLKDSGESCLVFHGTPESPSFLSVYEALLGLAEEFPTSSHARPTAGVISKSNRQPITNQGGYQADAAGPSTALHLQARDGRRSRIADLTEERLRDPRGFRDRAKARGAGNRVVTNVLRPTPASSTTTTRRSRHFNLADIERMRVEDEIANTPSYAEEYVRNHQGAAATSYRELVSRSYDFELIGRQALDGTNAYRARKGLPPLRWHDGIAKIAAEHAVQMASGRMPFSHDGFDARVNAFPVAHRRAAENLALNQGVADVARVAVDGWIKSPGHEKNLSGPYLLCGIGVGRSANGTFYLTQLFAA